MLGKEYAWIGVAFAVVVSTSSTVRPSVALADSVVERGEYLTSIMDCTGCHTPGALAGNPDLQRYLAGSGIGFEMPGFGVFFPPNLTPDMETGIGKWSEDEIMMAVRGGVRPDGRELVPDHAMAFLRGPERRRRQGGRGLSEESSPGEKQGSRAVQGR